MSVFEQEVATRMGQFTMATEFEKVNLYVQIAVSL